MTTKEKAPGCANTVGAQIEAPTGDTSSMNMAKPRCGVNASTSAIDYLAPLQEAFDAAELLSVDILASGALFKAIAENTREYTVVHPVAKAGEKVSSNLTEAVLNVQIMLGDLLSKLTIATRGAV